MTRSVQLDIPIVLPGVDDDQDECVARLIALLGDRGGIERVHVTHGDESTAHEAGAHPDGASRAQATLCLHYDPDRISLTQITDLAERAGADIVARYGHDVIPIRLVGAEDEGARLEAVLRGVPGVTGAAVNYPGQLVRVEFDRQLTDLATIRHTLVEAGAAPLAPPLAAQPEARAGWYQRNRELAWSLASGALLLSGWLIERRVGSGIALASYIAAYMFGARDTVGHTLRDARRGRFHFNIDFLMVVAALGAAILGEWVEGALLLFLFSLGHALEHYALGRARHAIGALAELAPQTATVLRDGGDVVTPIAQVRPGDRVMVRPAERIPVDGTVRDGRSGVNQAPITGESMPVNKAPGDPVFAGSVNGEGALTVEVTAAVGDRTLDRVIRLVAEAETQKAPTQQFTDRFERVFVPLVLVADILVIFIPPILGMWSWTESFYRGMALLVAASPCALALGTPAAVLAGIAQAARKGVLIKGGAHLEMLGTIQVLALDKTGTITVGEPSVTDVIPAGEASRERLLTIAAAVERRSQHPIARAVVRAAELEGMPSLPTRDLESVTGRGVRARVEGRRTDVGRLLMFEDAGSAIPADIRATVARLESEGRTTMIVGQPENGADQWLGVIAVADEPRPGVRDTLRRLHDVGLRRIVMLTGDNAAVGQAIGKRVGVDDVRAGLLPEDKVAAIRELAREGQVAMVGDGVNDAPALAHATVGIAMGGAGTAAALETADVALMADDLSRLTFAIRLSRIARVVIKQNLYLSLAVIGILITATTSGVIGIGPAVIVHEGSTLLVIGNAMRLLAFDET